MLSASVTPAPHRDDHGESVERDEDPANGSVEEIPPLVPPKPSGYRLFTLKDPVLMRAELKELMSTDKARENTSQLRQHLVVHDKYLRGVQLTNTMIQSIVNKEKPTLQDEKNLEIVMEQQKEILRGLRDVAELIRSTVTDMAADELQIAQLRPPPDAVVVQSQEPEKPVRGRGRQKDPPKEKEVSTPVYRTPSLLNNTIVGRPERAVKDRTPANGKATPTLEEVETPACATPSASSAVPPPSSTTSLRSNQKGRRGIQLNSTPSGTPASSTNSSTLPPPTSTSSTNKEPVEKRPKREAGGASQPRKQRASTRLGASASLASSSSSNSKTPKSSSSTTVTTVTTTITVKSTTKDGTKEDEPIYCTCNRESFGDMIGCDNDKCVIEWFHFECVQLKVKPKGKWFCPDCRHPDSAKLPKVSSTSSANSNGKKETRSDKDKE